MSIHPWLAEKFALIREIPSFQAVAEDPAQYGERFMGYLQDPSPWAPPAGIVADDVTVDGEDGAVPVRVFRSAERADEPTSALLWMHGGGFVSGSVDDTESLIPAFELAARAGAVVVSVDYRLAVDGVHYPAPLDDTMAAWNWLVAHATDLGIDPARIFIGRASVGGNLAVATSVRLRDDGETAPRGMLLGYPLAHFPVPPNDPQDAAVLDTIPAMLRMPVEFQMGIVHNYIGRVDDLPSDVVPGDFDVAGLPEAWIAPSEYDDLRPSGELLATQLADAGVPTHLEIARGMVHGHLGRGPSLEPVDTNLEFFAAALRG